MSTLQIDLYEFIIQGIQNPHYDSASKNFQLQLFKNGALIEENLIFGKLPFTKPPDIIREEGAVDKIGLGTSFKVKFRTKYDYPANTAIRVTLPLGYSTEDPKCQYLSVQEEFLDTKVYHSKIEIDCLGISQPLIANTDQEIRINGVVNPQQSGEYKGFKLDIMLQATPDIMETLEWENVVNIPYGQVTITYSSGSNYRYSNTSYDLYLTYTNPIPNGGYISLNLNGDFQKIATTCTVNSGIDFSDLANVKCDHNAADAATQLRIHSFTEVNAEFLMWVTIDMTNPIVSGNYPISVESFTGKNQLIDKGENLITITETIGKPEIFNAYAVEREAQLSAGNRGPFQILLMLTNNLPKTNDTEETWTWMKIFIEQHVPLNTDGQIKCYFHNYYPCKFLTWTVDTGSLPTRTTIIVKTPTNIDFRLSAIPFTITTEGGPTQVMNDGVAHQDEGFTIDPVVQRYKIYVWFYTFEKPALTPQTQVGDVADVDNDHTYHEVLFTEWIPATFTLTGATYDFSVQEMAEFGELVIEFDNTLALPATRQYRIWIEFVNPSTNVFDKTMGFNNIEQTFMSVGYEMDWMDIPCHGETFAYTDVSINFNQVACKFYPGRDNGNSYLKAYGFDSPAVANDYKLRFPHIGFHNIYTSYATSLYVQIIEETFGERSEKVVLYEKSWYKSVGMNSQSIGSFSGTTYAYSAIAMTDRYPDKTHAFTFTFTAPADTPFKMIMDFSGTLFTGTSGYDHYQFPVRTSKVCTETTCRVYENPINWIVYEPTTSISNGAAFSLTITNWKTLYYATDISYTVAFHKGNRAVQKGTGTIRTEANALASQTFTTGVAAITYNTPAQYQVQFTTTTELRDQSSIKLVFTNLTLPAGDQFYCTIDQSAYDVDGIGCAIEGSNTIGRISNLAAIAAATQITIQINLNSDGVDTGKRVAITTMFSTFDVDQGTATLTVTHNAVGAQWLTYNVLNTHISTRIARSGEVAPFKFTFTPANTYALDTCAEGCTNAGKWEMKLTFSAGFQTPNNAATDDIYCYLKPDGSSAERHQCSVTTLSPLVIKIGNDDAPYYTTRELTAGTQYEMTVTSRYEYPNGIRLPTTAGQYSVQVEVTDKDDTTCCATKGERNLLYLDVLAIPLTSLVVHSACKNAAPQASIYFIKFQSTLAIPAQARTGGAIFIDFPTPQFANDLGTGLKTGDRIPCNCGGVTAECFAKLATKELQCYLIESKYTGEPASVQITNFDAIAADTLREIAIAKITNPANGITDGHIGIRIYNNEVLINYDTFHLWIDAFTTTPTAASGTPTAPIFEASTYAYDASKQVGVKIFSDTNLVIGDQLIYVTDPNEFVLDYTLSSTNIDKLTSFPTIGWVYMLLKAAYTANGNDDGTFTGITNPSSFHRVDIAFTCRVIDNQIWTHTVTHTISHVATNSSNIGAITDGALTALNTDMLMAGVNPAWVKVKFTTIHKIPASGAILIYFKDTTKVDALPDCRSAISYTAEASLLLHSNPGGIDCSVVTLSGNTGWYIKGFAEIAEAQLVTIVGQVNAKVTTAAANLLDIITYGTQDANVLDNGKLIDRQIDIQFAIGSIERMSIDFSETWRQVVRMEGAKKFPVKMRFTTDTSNAFDSTKRIKVTFQQNLITTALATFVEQPNWCNFVRVDNGKETRCKIDDTSVLTGAVDWYFLITMYGSDALPQNVEHELTISRMWAQDGLNGQEFTATPGEYTIKFQYWNGAIISGTPDQEKLFWTEIVPSKFTTLKVWNHVRIINVAGPVELDITFANNIANENIYIEFPTKIDAQTVFDDDLGTGLRNGAVIPCDFYLLGPYTCYLQHGAQAYGVPARIVVSTVSQSASDRMVFAFQITNPNTAALVKILIPITVYTSGNSFGAAKTHYQVWDDNLYLVAAPTEITDAQSGAWAPFQSGNVIQTAADFTIPTKTDKATGLEQGDSYVIKFPYDMTDTYVLQTSFATNTCTASTGLCEARIYAELNWVVIIVGATQWATDTSVTIANVVSRKSIVPAAVVAAESTLLAYANIQTDDFGKQSWISYPAFTTHVIKDMSTSFSLALAGYGQSGTDVVKDLRYEASVTITSEFSEVTYVTVAFPTNLVPNTDCYVDKDGVGLTATITSLTVDATNRLVILNIVKNTASQVIKFICDQVTAGGSVEAVGNFDIKLWQKVQADWTAAADDNKINEILAQDPSWGIIADTFATPYFDYFEFAYERYWADYQVTSGGADWGSLRFLQTTAAPYVVGDKIHLTLIGATMGSFIPFSSSDLTSSAIYTPSIWEDVTETEMYCTINTVQHGCTAATGTSKVTIVLEAAIAAGTHHYKIGHVGVRDNTKGGFHLQSGLTALELQLKYDYEPKLGASPTYGLISEPFYIGTRDNSLPTFKLLDQQHLLEAEMNYLTWSFTCSASYDIKKMILEFPVSEYEVDMWTDKNLGSADWHKWYNGDQIPCSTLGSMTEDADFKCIMEEGSVTGLKRSIKVHITGVTQTSGSTAQTIKIMLFDIQIPTGAFAAKTKFKVYLHTFSYSAPNYVYQSTSWSPPFSAVDPSGGTITGTLAAPTSCATDVITSTGMINYQPSNILVFTATTAAAQNKYHWIELAYTTGCEYTNGGNLGGGASAPQSFQLFDQKNGIKYLLWLQNGADIAAAATFQLQTVKCPYLADPGHVFKYFLWADALNGAYYTCTYGNPDTAGQEKITKSYIETLGNLGYSFSTKVISATDTTDIVYYLKFKDTDMEAICGYSSDKLSILKITVNKYPLKDDQKKACWIRSGFTRKAGYPLVCLYEKKTGEDTVNFYVYGFESCNNEDIELQFAGSRQNANLALADDIKVELVSLYKERDNPDWRTTLDVTYALSSACPTCTALNLPGAGSYLEDPDPTWADGGLEAGEVQIAYETMKAGARSAWITLAWAVTADADQTLTYYFPPALDIDASAFNALEQKNPWADTSLCPANLCDFEVKIYTSQQTGGVGPQVAQIVQIEYAGQDPAGAVNCGSSIGVDAVATCTIADLAAVPATIDLSLALSIDPDEYVSDGEEVPTMIDPKNGILNIWKITLTISGYPAIEIVNPAGQPGDTDAPAAGGWWLEDLVQQSLQKTIAAEDQNIKYTNPTRCQMTSQASGAVLLADCVHKNADGFYSWAFETSPNRIVIEWKSQAGGGTYLWKFSDASISLTWPKYLYDPGYMTFNGDWNSHYQLSRFENTEGTLYQEILHQLEPIEYTATWYNINDGQNQLNEIGFSVTVPLTSGYDPTSGETTAGTPSVSANQAWSHVIEFTTGVADDWTNAAGSAMDKARFQFVNHAAINCACWIAVIY